MPRHISPRSTVEHLQREAKRWLRALRDGDPEARARLDAAGTRAGDPPTLRDVQLALAREYGFAGWTALRDAVAANARGRIDPALVRRFLDNACPDHHVRGPWDLARARGVALRLLARHPGLRTATLATAVACGEVEEVALRLAERPAAASTPDDAPATSRGGAGEGGDTMRDMGPKGWPPLLYLCFARLPLDVTGDGAVEIARLLLDHGADPNAWFPAGDVRYTALVGVVGGGEEERPPHPQADALARLLMARGAEPYDPQVTYNVHIGGDPLWWLQLVHEQSVARGRAADWADPRWPMFDMGPYGDGARWYLDLAVERDLPELAAWCLAHGASPVAPEGRAPHRPRGTPYQAAVRRGRTAIAELLVRHGAPREDVALPPDAHVAAAALAHDGDAVRALLARHGVPAGAHALHAAARADDPDALALLLDAGASIEAAGHDGQRPLHAAAAAGAARAAALLVARGAEVDPVERRFGATPLSWATWAQHLEVAALLAAHSRDVPRVAYAGAIDRLRALLEASPDAARGATLLHLPADDEARAIEAARLLLAHGADPRARDARGLSPAERAAALGMAELEALLREAGERSG